MHDLTARMRNAETDTVSKQVFVGTELYKCCHAVFPIISKQTVKLPSTAT